MNNIILPEVKNIIPNGLETWTNNKKITLFEDILKSTNRTGMDSVLEFIHNSDFYTAPSSTNHHSNYKGGLLDHSILVYITALSLKESLSKLSSDIKLKVTDENIAISTLLHDICKTFFYKEVVKWKKNEMNQWESYMGYEIEDQFPMGHGEKSVILLQNYGLSMTVDEMMAIRYHMGQWDIMSQDNKYSYLRAIDKYPLVSIVQSADFMSSLILEKEQIK